MAITADGLITAADNSDLKNERDMDAKEHSFNWLSTEDKKYFSTFTKEIGTMIMGSTTFKNAGRTFFKERLTVILSRNPDQFASHQGVVYKSGNPKEIVQELESMGINQAVLAGGTKTNSEFLEAGLVDYIYLTIEPKIFGKGLRFVDGIDLKVDLKLESCEKLNETGTLLLKYRVEK